MRTRTIGFVAAGIWLLALAPAAAETSTDDTYCAVNISESSTLTCAASEAELAALWNGSRSARATQFLIARLYGNQNYNTDAGTLEIYVAGDCTASATGVDYQIADLGSWRDRVSSFKSFGNCATRLWSSTSFGGTAYPSASGWLASSTYLGAAFNDHARSAQFT